MPIRPRLQAHSRYELTFDQTMELEIGPGQVPAFDSDDERRRAWRVHRGTLGHPSPGRRLWGFWQYDWPRQRPRPWGGGHEAQALIEAGFVGPDELQAIQREWQRLEKVCRVRSSVHRGPVQSRQYWGERRSYGIPDDFERPSDVPYEADQ